MRTPASIARHPIHPMLITIPIGLWVFSFVCDLVVYFSEGNEVAVLWYILGFWTMAGGLAGALVAAVPGLIDYLALKDRHIRTLATTHMAINLGVVALYSFNLWVRSTERPDILVGFGLSALAIVLLGFSGWIGAEMVHVHGVGVADDRVAARVDEDRVAARVVEDRKFRAEPSSTHLGPT